MFRCSETAFDNKEHDGDKAFPEIAGIAKDNDLESWDIAGAFLKGFDFKRIPERLKKLGLDAPTGQVVVFPPMNVWRHLQKFPDVFRVPQHALHEYGLLCLKPIYGLNDAPLAWQLCLHEYILELGAAKSKLEVG